MNKIYIIGIGYKPLDKRAREIILNSEIILASKRLSEVFKRYEEYGAVKDKVKVINNVDETIAFIKSLIPNPQSPNIVLLASGDPTFFGIGRRAVREFGKEIVEILPDLSSIQIAFSRIKESWDDAFLMSLHGGPDPEKRRRLPYELDDIPYLLQRHNKILILTDKENNPAIIAKFLNSSLITRHSSLKIHVCEKLGYPDEKITEGTPEEIAEMLFATPNVVIVIKENSLLSFPLVGNPSELSGNAKKDCGQAAMTDKIKFGLSETEIIHSRGLITKNEVRAVTIHKLSLPQRGVLWDIGAGSGSVSIEAARLYPELKVFAVEKDEEQIKNIKENRIKFDAVNIEIIKGQAPDVLINLPVPDRVFIGGSGGAIKEIIEFVSSKISSGIVVINAITIETLNEAIKSLENKGFVVEVSEISVSRSKTVSGKRHMSALNPVFIITGIKQ
ncbi:MAG: precorrin-6y C5,15-methyltransferase (decarboxylating) subunit CbiE [Nitrospirae bacterium]|nr:precorrin-6y C5,15-methyltransferase (decarboxylating) subunit CbiE [Nitrospirota bacterium]MBI3378659.1 precorrin-6y C5,15-methyltransferase (decarboxylating) subunit CbiE [Nitrospirota bacterium]